MASVQQTVALGGRRQAVAVVGSSGSALPRVGVVNKAWLSGGSACLRHNALVAKVPGAVGQRAGHRAVVVMNTDTASGSYATALAELAESKDSLEAVNRDLESLEDVVKSEEIYKFLVSPVVEEDKKKDILKGLAKDAQYTVDTLSFLDLLVEKRRINLIKDIIKEWEVIYNEKTDTQVATVTSAVKIEKAQLALIAKKIQSLSGAKNVRIKNVVDPSLIAGFEIKYGKDGSCFIDMSVKGQLDKLAAQIEFADKVAAF